MHLPLWHWLWKLWVLLLNTAYRAGLSFQLQLRTVYLTGTLVSLGL